MLRPADHFDSALTLIATYGGGARQKVVDEMVSAIRAHDLDTAKQWEMVGRVVDERLNMPCRDAAEEQRYRLRA